MANRIYTVRHGLAKGLKRRGGLGFVPQVGALTSEEVFLENLSWTGTTVYDVGGFEGIMSLFFARCVGPTGRLITFEPNPANYAAIVANVALNGFAHVDVRPIAVGAAPEGQRWSSRSTKPREVRCSATSRIRSSRRSTSTPSTCRSNRSTTSSQADCRRPTS